MGKISIFGVSRSGKTCYLYAMSQVLQRGAKLGDFRLSIIANDIAQQAALNSGYLEMAADGRWPQGNNTTNEYDLNVRVQNANSFKEIIPSLILYDYAGGVWTNNNPQSVQDRKQLMKAFAESSAIIFLVDGITLLHAMNNNDLHPSHRGTASIQEIVDAGQQIAFVENMFKAYKQNGNKVAPVMVVVTKADVFATSDELKNGKKLIKEYLPSIFAKGSQIDSAITDVSLGTHLGVGQGNQITGNLSLNTQYNIHLPIVYSLYAYLDGVYDQSSPAEQSYINQVLKPLREMMYGKVEMYNNGDPVIPV